MGRAGPLQDEVVDSVHGGAHVVPDRVLVGGRMAELGEVGGEDPVGDRLAVDKDTVVVEDDQVIPHSSDSHPTPISQDPTRVVNAKKPWSLPSGRDHGCQRLFGGVLLSHRVPPAVPSALKGLASGFGM